MDAMGGDGLLVDPNKPEEVEVKLNLFERLKAGLNKLSSAQKTSIAVAFMTLLAIPIAGFFISQQLVTRSRAAATTPLGGLFCTAGRNQPCGQYTTKCKLGLRVMCATGLTCVDGICRTPDTARPIDYGQGDGSCARNFKNATCQNAISCLSGRGTVKGSVKKSYCPGPATWRCCATKNGGSGGGASCAGGTLCDGTPVTGTSGQIICGLNKMQYACSKTGAWVPNPSKPCVCTKPSPTPATGGGGGAGGDSIKNKK